HPPSRPASGALPAWPAPWAAEFFVDLPTLPIGAEEPADPKQHDSRDGYADTRAEHRPVEPEGAAVIEQIDRKPHQAEGDPDREHRVEDALAANVSNTRVQELFAPRRCHLCGLPPGIGRGTLARRRAAPSACR